MNVNILIEIISVLCNAYVFYVNDIVPKCFAKFHQYSGISDHVDLQLLLDKEDIYFMVMPQYLCHLSIISAL